MICCFVVMPASLGRSAFRSSQLPVAPDEISGCGLPQAIQFLSRRPLKSSSRRVSACSEGDTLNEVVIVAVGVIAAVEVSVRVGKGDGGASVSVGNAVISGAAVFVGAMVSVACIAGVLVETGGSACARVGDGGKIAVALPNQPKGSLRYKNPAAAARIQPINMRPIIAQVQVPARRGGEVASGGVAGRVGAGCWIDCRGGVATVGGELTA